MQVTAGVEPGQVIQRKPDGAASVSMEGTCSCRDTQPVMARIVGPGYEWESDHAGQAIDGHWTAHLDGIPAGGPYAIEVACSSGQARVSDLWVGEVWVLAGQSNMEGQGALFDSEAPSARVRVMSLSDRWAVAEDPLHWPCEATDRAFWPCPPELRHHFAQEQRSSRVKGAGPGVAFGVALSAALDVPVGLVACARGGASMQDWSPERVAMGGASLYGALLRRVHKAGGVRGILWYQGESDTNPVDAQDYPRLFRKFIGSLRADLGQPALPFLFVQLGRLVSESTLADLRAWNVVQDSQRHANLDLSGTAMTTTVDLDLEDAIHISTRAQKRLGRRLAILARATAYGDTSVKTGPKPGRITVDGRARDQITIEFEDVNRSLRPAGRLTGFSLRNMDGYHIPILFREEVDHRRPTLVRLYATRSIPRGAALHYGWGRDPYCNLVDEMDMAAPAFGPIYL